MMTLITMNITPKATELSIERDMLEIPPSELSRMERTMAESVLAPSGSAIARMNLNLPQFR
jgi:hypothetical protein